MSHGGLRRPDGEGDIWLAHYKLGEVRGKEKLDTALDLYTRWGLKGS